MKSQLLRKGCSPRHPGASIRAGPDEIVAFPRGTGDWADYLSAELDTAKKQGFDVQRKGVNIIVKKNGRILRRATGQPPWGSLISTIEVADGSKFGMPGDTEKYGGP